MPLYPSAEEFSSTVFDYIVIGGGNAGVPLAVRLAEDRSARVGLLEAGSMVSDDPLITQPKAIAMATGNPTFDWCFKTEPQKHLGQRSIPVPRGKGLGGTSLLHYLAWDRASKQEYDSWKHFSDPEGGWDWDSLLPYFKKAENASASQAGFDPYPAVSLPDAQITREGTPHEEVCGLDGPVKTSYNVLYTDIMAPAIKAFNSLGAPTNANGYGGETDGVKNLKRTVDKDSGTRVSSASAYLDLAKEFDNLHILTNAMVTKLLFETSLDDQGNHVVRGAEISVHGEHYTTLAAKEVVLCCGSVQTPQVLELSGIGNASLLKSLGIPCRVDLSGIGENLFDRIFTPTQFLLRPDVRTFDEFRNNPTFLAEETAKYESSGQGWIAASDSIVVYNPLHRVVGETKFPPFMKSLKDSISAAKESNSLTPLQIEQYQVQLKWLEKNPVPNLETMIFSKGLVAPVAGRSYFVMLTGVQVFS
ncbi:GMC oxidoreductase-domain-containing protein [Gymnopilus junonius]|uniref:GMC oxidoreductase-domain-containing protein n=1 Tax=Gymnopilus junonius TaxID=109634 RepID=A0A9P5NBW2_GYMJU|nr:GMC oxidoreductase-domain-containing protein [Gymnopilus junonius]